MAEPVKNKGRGFAGMDPAKQRAIAAKGGKAAHEKGTAYQWDSNSGRAAGRKGGIVSRGGRAAILPPKDSNDA